ncbi:hypothetical protein GGS20DRAFT_141862 [Poronia punctata]|nr:hypothetical protein GGS20DRAFT_141862 [Poronia punctata]
MIPVGVSVPTPIQTPSCKFSSCLHDHLLTEDGVANICYLLTYDYFFNENTCWADAFAHRRWPLSKHFSYGQLHQMVVSGIAPFDVMRADDTLPSIPSRNRTMAWSQCIHQICPRPQTMDPESCHCRHPLQLHGVVDTKPTSRTLLTRRFQVLFVGFTYMSRNLNVPPRRHLLRSCTTYLESYIHRVREGRSSEFGAWRAKQIGRNNTDRLLYPGTPGRTLHSPNLPIEQGCNPMSCACHPI